MLCDKGRKGVDILLQHLLQGFLGQLALVVEGIADAIQIDFRLPHDRAGNAIVDGLAISEIIEPRDGQCLAREFTRMPNGRAWTGPQPYLAAAAAALAAGL